MTKKYSNINIKIQIFIKSWISEIVTRILDSQNYESSVVNYFF